MIFGSTERFMPGNTADPTQLSMGLAAEQSDRHVADPG